MAAFHAPALAIADGLGLFRLLHATPATPAELARTLNIELRAVETIAGLMAALDFLVQADGRYYLTDVARYYLVPDSPYYWGGMLRRIRETPMDTKRLFESLQRGNAAEQARVTGLWQTRTPSAEALKAFTHAMHAHSFALAMRIAPALGLDGVERLLDVAGGSGSYSIAAAIHDPQISCTVLDLPPVCEVTAEYAAALRVGGRVGVIPADMFADSWPEGYDAALFSDIFHDWDDERCAFLSARAHQALRPGGRILVHEMILAETKDGPLPAVAYSMVMLFAAQGRQRSAREVADILSRAGFIGVRVTMTSGGYALIEGSKDTGKGE